MEISPPATEQAFLAVNLQTGTTTAAAALGAAALLQGHGGGSGPDTAQSTTPGKGLGNRLDTAA